MSRMLVTMFAGGGIKPTSGGVGTFILYLMNEWTTEPDAPKVRVIDTRGQGGKASMAVAFPKAVGLVAYLGATGRLGVMHIHMNSYGSTLRKGIICLLGRLLRAPGILHLHGSDFKEFFFGLSGLPRRAVRFVLNSAHEVIVLSESWREFLVADIGVDPRKISVILNGVRGPAQTDKPASQPGAPARIVFLGRIGERKGVPELIEAFRSPLLSARSWTATIAGDGPVEEFRTAVERAGLRDRVTLPGWLDRTATSDLLRQADIFVLPSHEEAMPIAILEAMAHRVAVVTTPVGAIPEFLTDGETALLVPAGNAGQLANAIARLIDDSDERCRIAAAGQRLFSERLHIRAVAERIQALYQSATNTTRGTEDPSQRASVRWVRNQR